MDEIKIKFPSKCSGAMLSRESKPQKNLARIEKEHEVLIVYEEKVPQAGSHYAGVQYKGGIRPCVARPFENVDEAVRIYNILISCKHPNIFRPLSLWTYDDDDEERKVKAFMTFTSFDGYLADLRKEIFLLEDKDLKDNDNNLKPNAYGFTTQGSKMFSEILNVVDYINGLYGHHPGTQASLALELSPLRVNHARFVYKKLAEGRYQAFLWADFFPELPVQRWRKDKHGAHIEPTVEDIKSYNLSSIGKCLKDLFQACRVTENLELKKLQQTLINGKTLHYSDLVWEPGLWSVDTKIYFIREVFWCRDNKAEREKTLKEMPSLQLKECIKQFGFNDQDGNLFESVSFLRNKIVAHQDSLYTYNGEKDDVGLHNRRTEIEVQKKRPDYMIKLVQQIRQLNWIQSSPFIRSQTSYIQDFKCTS